MFASRSLFLVASVTATAALAAAETVTVPRGTLVHVRVEKDLRSDSVREGDSFPATIAENVYVDGRTAIAAGGLVDGMVTVVKSPARGDRSGVLGLKFVRLRALDGQRYLVEGSLVGLRQRPQSDGEVALIRTSERRAVVVIGDEADGPGKRPSSLVGNAGEDEGALAERWAGSGLSPELAEVEAGSELTFELRAPVSVERPAAE